MHENYLVHWGIKGQKWGIRRYQNEDGTYTELGKKRRNSDFGKGFNDEELANRVKRLNQEKLYRKLSKEDRDLFKNEQDEQFQEVTGNINKISSGIRGVVNRQSNKKASIKRATSLNNLHSELSNMSDDEIRRIVNRLNLEEQYQTAMNKRYVSSGKITARDILDNLGDVMGIAAGTIGMAMVIKKMKG